MAIVFPESRVVEIWQERLVDRTDLVTEEGESLKVVYPGRPNDGRGADLKDAIINSGGRLMRGEVEVHVKSSGWREHGHHLDPAYNGVVLHVVLNHDTASGIFLQNGNSVPTLALQKFIGNLAQQPAHFNNAGGIITMPCHENHHQNYIVGGILDAAGEVRFEAKADGFRTRLSKIEPGQLLYQEIMRALGYSRNKEPMEELARRIPLQKLESDNADKMTDAECLVRYQALLLGTAGLLPSQCPEYCVGYEADINRLSKLEGLWGASGDKSAMSAGDWCFFKVRPVNLPTRRIMAMSYLLLRYRHEGLLAGLMRMFETSPADAGFNRLEKSLIVEHDNHQGRGAESGKLALLGSGRAADIVINVLLPFTAGWARITSRPELAEKALEVYHRYPRLSINTIDRHMLKQLRTEKQILTTARRQQGLLHIYKTLCSQGKCRECPLAKGWLLSGQFTGTFLSR